MSSVASLVLILLVAEISVQGHLFNPHHEEWKSWKTEFARKYQSESEEALRLKLWLRSKFEVNEHNKKFGDGLVTYEKGLNAFSDYTDEERSRIRMPTTSTFNMNEFVRSFSRKHRLVSDKPLNRTVDWRKLGAVTSVKNQGNCGDCYAFAATGALEGQVAQLQDTKLYDFSEQQVLDCVYDYRGTLGCNGGWYYNVYNFYENRFGPLTETEYPYTGVRGNCTEQARGHSHFNITGYLQASTTEDELKEAVATIGPIAVAIFTDRNFDNYRSGVFYDGHCYDTPPSTMPTNHAVTVVGYGTEEANGKLVDYWLVKNSWGDTWGEQGYIKMARNANNMCQIACFGYYPVVEKSSGFL